jgi:hypothetical protein
VLRGTIMLPKSSTRPNPKNLKRKIQLVSRHESFENLPEYYNGKAVNRLNLTYSTFGVILRENR